MMSYTQFRRAVRDRESDSRYDCVNQLGFLGAYQFGMARLCDLGFTKRIPGKDHGFSNSFFEWIDPKGRETFLSSRRIQDDCFDRHVQMLKPHCRFLCPDNISGAIAAAHLLGPGGLDQFIRNKIDSTDAFGTKISEYFELFKGYEIP